MSDDKINILYTGSRRESNVFTNLALGNCMENIMNLNKGQSIPKQTMSEWNFSTNTSLTRGLSNHKTGHSLRRDESLAISIPKGKRYNNVNGEPIGGAAVVGGSPGTPGIVYGSSPVTTSPIQYGSYLDVYSGNNDSDRISRGASPQPLSGSAGEYRLGSSEIYLFFFFFYN